MLMRGFFCAAAAVLVGLAVTATAAELPADIVEHLERDPYVYISSTRKSGDLGAASEIWFSWDGEAVLVGTGVKSYRVRRIRAGRTAARIWLGGTDGPWFGATGSLLEGKAAEDAMLDAFGEKYGDTFKESWKAKFREGFEKGTRVVVRYTPTGQTGKGPEGLPTPK